MCENYKESPISLVKWKLMHDDEDFLTALCNRRRRKYKAAWFDYELRKEEEEERPPNQRCSLG